MFMKPSHALLAAMALVAAPAFAQDTAPAADAPAAETPAAETPVEAPATEAPAADAAATDEAATDEAATDEAAPADATAAPATDEAAEDGEPRVGSYYLMEEHGDWMIRCIRAGQGKDPCEMYKLLSDEDENAVAELTLIPLSNGQVAAGATIIAPLETDLTAGLGLQVDSGETARYPFNVCYPVGCISRLGFTEAEVTAMKRGNRATVELVPFGDGAEEPVRLGVSLAGFTAAFDSLTAYAAAPAPEPEAAPAEEAPAEDAPAEDAPAE